MADPTIIGFDELPEWARKWLQRFTMVGNEANSSSDRACAIVMVAVIEELLRSLLADYLPKTSIGLKAVVAPGNMRRLIDLSEAVGLIYSKLAGSLREVNEVRNRFAHRVLDDPGFDSAEIRSLVEQLTFPLNVTPEIPAKNGRDRFMTVCGGCFLVLILQHLNMDRLKVRNEQLGEQTLDLSSIPFPHT